MRTLRAAFFCGALAASLAGFLFSMGAFAGLTLGVFGVASAGVPLAVGGQWAGALLLAFGLAWTSVDIQAWSLKWVVAAMALVETMMLSWVLHFWGVVWPPFTALAAGIFATGFGIAYSLSKSGQRRRTIDEVFGERISRATYRKFLESDEPLAFTGEEREASVVVCKLLNRRELAGMLSAPDFVELSNRFLHAGSQALTASGGVLAGGDGEHIYAVFGAPLIDPAHVGNACKAAFTLGQRMEVFGRECSERWNVNPDYRIAVNSGQIIAGVFGSPERSGFGVAGEAFDFCRRLCQANLIYGTRILMGPQAFTFSRGVVEARPVELIWNRAEETREEIYELLAPCGGLSPEEKQWRDVFWIGVILYREQRWEEAVAHFETILRDAGTDDGLCQFYLERAARACEAAAQGERITVEKWEPYETH